MHTSKTIEWLAEKLQINSKGLDLYITANYQAYFNQPTERRMKTANSVQYYHPKLGIIYLGPDFIKIGRKIVAKVGYTSEEYIEKVQKRT